MFAIDADTGDKLWSTDDGVGRSSPTVVADPENGNSVDSRIHLGTLGHHHEWMGVMPDSGGDDDRTDDPPVDDDVYDAVATLSADDSDQVTGADLTILRGRLIDGDNEIDGVTVTGGDYTLLRGHLFN
ncbi:hypothetical protein D8S78_16055 [Natrialba swarupiae]|nr:hypothetical protein [Natrialba swarupiae]